MADDVTPIEEAMDDVMDEDDDPLWFINTGDYDDGGLMAQQYDSGFERDELMPELPEQERLKADCKKSLFMQSSQDTPPDAASTQDQQREGSAMLSPTTLGAGVRDGMLDSLPAPKKHRKRPRKGLTGAKAASISQPPPQPRLADRIPIKGVAKFHVPGDPILPKAALEGIDGDLRRLHDDVLSREKSLLVSKNHGYPPYVVNVP